MSVLGTLTASVILNSSNFEGGMERAKFAAAQGATTIDRAMRDLERSVSSSLNSIAGAFAAGLGITALMAMGKTAIETAENLRHAAEVAGLSVEQFSALAFAAKQSGVSMESLEMGSKKLNVAITDAAGGGAKFSGIFKALGVDITGTSATSDGFNKVLLQVADTFKNSEDGPIKVAAAVKLFGKNGADMIPLLNQGAAAIKAMQDEALKLGRVLGTDAAEQAHQFHDSLDKLTNRSTFLAQALGNTVLPAINAIVTSMIQGRTEGGLYEMAIRGVTEALAQIKGEGPKAELEKITNQIKLATSAARALKDERWYTFDGAGQYAEQAAKLNGLLQQRAALEHGIFLDEIAAQDKLAIDGQIAKRRKKLGPGLGEDGASTVDIYQQENAELDKQIAKLKGVGELEAYIEKLQESRYSKLTPAQKQELIDKESMIVKLEQEKVSRAEILKSDEELLKAQQALLDLQANYASSLADQIAQEQFGLTLIGKTQVEAAKLTEIHRLDLELKKQLANLPDGVDGNVILRMVTMNDAAKAAIGQTIDLKFALQDQSKVWLDLSQKAGAFFGDLVVNGKSAFTKLRAELKTFVQELLALFAQKWVLQMVAGVVGGSAGTALASQAAGLGANTISGTISSYAGSALFGASADPALILSSGGMQGLGSSGMIGASGLQSTMSSWMSTMGVTTTALGIFAVALVGAAVVSNLFSQGWSAQGSGRGPGGVGSTADMLFRPGAGLAYATSLGTNFLTSLGISDRIANVLSGAPVMDRLFGHSATHADASGISGSVSGSAISTSGWQDYSQRGGLFSSDHRWTDTTALTGDQAKPFTDAMAMIHGQMVALGALVGDDAADLLKNYSKEFNIQLSGLSDADAKKAITDFFNSVYVEQAQLVLGGATGAIKNYITQFKGSTADLVNALGSVAQIFDIVKRNPMGDVAASIAASQNPLNFALANNEKAMRAAMSAYDGTLATTQNLATATRDYYNAQVQLLVGIKQAKAAIDDMFGATFRNIQIAGLKDNQAKYNFYQQDAADLQRQALASSDPATIQRLAGLINNDINAAFSLLSPEEQQAQSGAFLTRGRDTQSAIDARMERIAQDTADATQKMMADIKNAIEAGAEAQQTAANTQANAANTQLQAANTPLTLILRTGGGQQVVTIPP